MSTRLPRPIADYFAAQNDHEIDAMLAGFADAAIVRDEGREHRGRAAIRDWIEETTRKYRPAVAVTDVAETGGTIVVTCRISGTFPGSPIDLRYAFVVQGGEIVRLEISL
jgi:hypothetical protein